MRFKAEWYRENECNARKNGAGKMNAMRERMVPGSECVVKQIGIVHGIDR